MSIITLPTSFRPVEFSFGQNRYDTTERSDSTGSEAARVLAPPRWTCSVTSAEFMTLIEAGTWRAWLHSGRGRVNVFAIYDPVRQAPQGTMRGSPRLAAQLAAGAVTATLIGGTWGTLKRGDLLQVGTGVGTSQLVEVVADASPTGTGSTANWTDGLGNPSTWTDGSSNPTTWSDLGTVTITFEPPTRIAFAKQAVVTWDKPLAYYRQQGNTKSRYSTRAKNREGGFAQDFEETFDA
jgi:hypothetical protein